MKFLHTGDLHLGKTLHEFSLIEDQRMILNQMISLAVREQVDAVVLAGDIYDRSIPPAEAVLLLDDFLTGLTGKGIPVMIVAGNHDSGDRLLFAARLLEKQGITIAGDPLEPKQVNFHDEYGDVRFTLLPFLKPAVFGERTASAAAASALALMGGEKPELREVCVTHLFVTDGERPPELSDSESFVSVGGLDSVEAGILENFDYVALGHIHKAQQIGSRPIYYSGSPLAYSFSEAGKQKTVNLVTLREKGNCLVVKAPLYPLHEMRRIRGALWDLVKDEVTSIADSADYLEVTLTDEEELVDPIGVLREAYPNVMQLIMAKYEPQKEGGGPEEMLRSRQSVSPEDFFHEFYEYVTGREMTEDRKRVIAEIMKGNQE